MLSKLKNTGFFHVFLSSVTNKIISFCSGIFLIRLLSKSDYGLYSYTSNIITIFMLFSGLGTTTGMLQFGSENFKDKQEIGNAFIKFGFGTGVIFNITITFGIFLFTYLWGLPIKGANNVLLLMAGIPIFAYTFETIQVNLRAAIRNKEFAYLNSTNTFLIFFCSIIGALIFQLKGLVLFQYVAYLISIIAGVKVFNINFRKIKTNYILNTQEKSTFMKFSLTATFNNAISQLLYTIDIFLIGVFIKDTNIIAAYKTSTLIPFALNFIPMSIMTYVYPYFARHSNDKMWIKGKFYQIIKYLGLFNFMISAILFLFAPIIIKLIYGNQYMDSLSSFRILAIGYFFAGTFRIISGNVLVMIKKVKINFYLSIVTGILNIILDILLIKYFGSVGASIATLTVFIFTSVFSTTYLVRWFSK